MKVFYPTHRDVVRVVVRVIIRVIVRVIVMAIEVGWVTNSLVVELVLGISILGRVVESVAGI